MLVSNLALHGQWNQLVILIISHRNNTGARPHTLLHIFTDNHAPTHFLYEFHQQTVDPQTRTSPYLNTLVTLPPAQNHWKVSSAAIVQTRTSCYHNIEMLIPLTKYLGLHTHRRAVPCIYSTYQQILEESLVPTTEIHPFPCQTEMCHKIPYVTNSPHSTKTVQYNMITESKNANPLRVQYFKFSSAAQV